MLPSVACLLGVYLHGFSGDLAARKFTQQGMTALDIVEMLPVAWKRLR
jgi:NAD(P)H-hydrate repair Nnr-like enzyme with NAD(P)H-hydrate dehydratase domain